MFTVSLINASVATTLSVKQTLFKTQYEWFVLFGRIDENIFNDRLQNIPAFGIYLNQCFAKRSNNNPKMNE